GMKQYLSFAQKITASVALSIGVAATSAAAENLTIRMDFSPWGIQAAMQLAQEKGWFEEAGLNVDIQDGRGSGNTLQLVDSGRVDVGQVQLGLLPQAREKGANVKAVAGWARRTDLGVLVDRDSDINTVEDFEGKTVAVFAA